MKRRLYIYRFICSAIEIGDEDRSVFHVEAIFNPFNREGQKFSSIMSVTNTYRRYHHLL